MVSRWVRGVRGVVGGSEGSLGDLMGGSEQDKTCILRNVVEDKYTALYTQILGERSQW